MTATLCVCKTATFAYAEGFCLRKRSMTKKRQTKIFVCKECKKEFEARADHEQQFCSMKCFGLNRSKNLRKYITCPICNKEFVKKRSTTKYCSVECQRIARKKQTIINCCVCGKEFSRPHCHTKGKNFCSRECYHNWQKENTKCENSPKWQGGIYHNTDGYLFLRQEDASYKAEHRIIAEQMIGRKLKENEVVHHIDENKTNNSPSNLIVMTRAEHARLHHTKKEV